MAGPARPEVKVFRAAEMAPSRHGKIVAHKSTDRGYPHDFLCSVLIVVAVLDLRKKEAT